MSRYRAASPPKRPYQQSDERSVLRVRRSCDCGIAYLIHTEPDGAHCQAAGDVMEIAERYDHLPGDEDSFTNGL
jgi:hypothetical protein